MGFDGGLGLRWVSRGFHMGFRLVSDDGFQMRFRWVLDGFQMGPLKHPKILTDFWVLQRPGEEGGLMNQSSFPEMNQKI